MIVKQIVDEDFINYKKPSMFIAFPYCDWKCEKESGERVCQNSTFANSPNIKIDIRDVILRYSINPITSAIVIGGLEPMCSFKQLISFIKAIRNSFNIPDDIVIYTGYYPNEIEKEIKQLKQYSNIIIKFGRFVPKSKNKYDDILGIKLISDNQFAIRIS